MVWLLYHLMAALDTIVYGLASAMFTIIYDIATTDFFKPEQIKEVADRIYVVVGVLMLFKLVVSAVQYMINPDVFDDKDKGMGGILRKIAVSLALIVAVPAIFNFMVSMQSSVIKTLPSIILGGNASESTGDDSIGFDLSFQVLKGFLKVRDGHEGGVGENQEIHDLGSFNLHLTDGCPATIIGSIVSGTDSCDYDYMIFISTAAGVFLCYILFSMIVEIAIRTIKFSIIQMLAPIPISGYVFDKSKLTNFAKTTIKVYTDLFIRMALVYFVIFAIREMVIKNNLINVLSIGKGGVSDTGSWFRGVVVNIAIIYGLLMFAKTAPKFISELLGLPDGGDFKDMFTRAGGLFGATVGAGKSFIASRINARREAAKEYRNKYGVSEEDWKGLSRKSKNKALKDAVGEYNKNHKENTVGRQAFRSGEKALRSGFFQSYVKGKGFKDTMSGADRAGQKEYELNKAIEENHSTRGAYRQAVIEKRMGIKPDLDVMNIEIEASKNASDKSKAALDFVHDNISDKLAGVRFADSMLGDSDFIGKLQFTNGVNEYSFGAARDANGEVIMENGRAKPLLKIDLTRMGEHGDMTIAGMLEELTTVAENKNGNFSGQDVATARKMRDTLRGEADKYVVNMTKKIAEDKSIRDADGKVDKALFQAKYGSLGFDATANPRFMTLIQEAMEADIIHSGDTQYGRKVWAAAKDKGILYEKADGTWDVKPDKMGEWFALNKSMGQTVQQENIAAKGTQAASAIAKSLADKFDNKS